MADWKQRGRGDFFLHFFLIFSVAISQFRGDELLASLRGMWLGALCPGGETGRSSDSALTFPGQQRGPGERNEKLSQQCERGKRECEGGGRLEVKTQTSTSIFTSVPYK